MRRTAITLLAGFALVGCGGSEAKNGAAKTAGIPLSIPNQSPAPASVKTTPTIDQYTSAVKQLIQKANTAVLSGRNGIAIESLSQAIGITPEDATLFRMRADVYSMLGENANARADFSTAVRLAPNDPDLYNFRGYFLMGQGLGAEARADFDKAVTINPKHAAALNNRGLLSLAGNDYQAAVTDFSLAIDADRNLSDAWNNRGFAQMKLNQPDKAMADIKQALHIKEDYVTAWNNCGLVAMQQEKFADAEKSFARAMELDPMDARWVNHHRTALIKQNRFAEAQQDANRIEWLNKLTNLTQVAGRNARDPRAWIVRGQHLMDGQQFNAAIQDFNRALAVSPGNAQALFDRAVAWVKLGDDQKAMLDCDESIVADPSLEAYSLRGDLWLRLENLDLAIADFESAKRFDEQVAVAYEKRAEKQRQAGATAEADADLTKAKEIREAMIEKPAAARDTATAEGFNPDAPAQ
ncbi:MAG: tetratricopeptide repeat protein [Planctomycetaceae bacterium]